MLRTNRGATLIEVLVVVILVSASVLVLSLTFPRAAANITNNRRQFFANNLASSRMREITEAPYPNIQTNIPNPTTGSPFAGVQGAYPNQGCDCNAVNLSGAQFQVATYTEAGVTYRVNQCIHLVDQTATGWASYCEDGTLGATGADKGIKSIRVRVIWTQGAQTKYTDMKGLVRR